MDGKERGWGGFFRGEKHVNQRTIKEPLTCSQHSWLSGMVCSYLEQVVKTRNLCPLQGQSLTASSHFEQLKILLNNLSLLHKLRHNPAPPTPGNIFIYRLWGELKHNFHFVQPLFCSFWGKKRRFQEWLCIQEVQTQPSSPRAFSGSHCTHQGQQPRHQGLVDVGCSQPLTLIHSHLATTCQPNGQQQHLLFHTAGSRQRGNSWQKRGFLSKKKKKDSMKMKVTWINGSVFIIRN